jgi:hypothetical protein
LLDYGLVRYIEESRAALVDTGLVAPAALTWLPDVTKYFEWLKQ